MTAETTSAPPDSEAVYPRRWAALVVLLVAFMLDLLSVTIVNVGLSSIQRDLGASPTDLEWISAAYLLSFAVALITAARLGDLRGRKLIFLLGIIGFAVTSLWCGIARSPAELITARVFQGLAAAAIAPQVMSILYTIFTGRERATVFGTFGLVSGVTQAGGLILGGALITADIGGLGWRTIFLITVPVAVALIPLAIWLVPESRVPGGTRPRWAATGVLVVGLVAIVFPLLEGRAYGWPVWCWLCLAAGILAVLGLAVFEHRDPGRRAGALLPVALFRNRTGAGGLLVLLLAFSGFSGFMMIFPLWLQDGQRFSALEAGLVSIAFAAGGLVMAMLTGRLTIRFGRFIVLAGCLLSVAGGIALLTAVHATSPTVNSWSLVPGLFALGVGMTFVMPPLTTLFLSAVPPEYAGSASGVWTTGQQFGSAVGVAAFGTVFFTVLDDHEGYQTAFTTSTIAVLAALLISAALCFILAPNRQQQDA
ncbi:drug resistance transporter, EmrB/QacA subfamily [Thermomonospora echinospora]|uniref:Drug resistance transporter, EmrB/QacA subfamily n=1 Tax=Thermomonospora echinospora TaxID=1992 RepID=A0A1H6D7D0_9ACTN|nr:MFS transporter [Thermomonospora echinospora]SEG81230.1 drug resistance transporter, EmrB/QacA subfamily [Thermomonospora echinospora]